MEHMRHNIRSRTAQYWLLWCFTFIFVCFGCVSLALAFPPHRCSIYAIRKKHIVEWAKAHRCVCVYMNLSIVWCARSVRANKRVGLYNFVCVCVVYFWQNLDHSANAYSMNAVCMHQFRVAIALSSSSTSLSLFTRWFMSFSFLL